MSEDATAGRLPQWITSTASIVGPAGVLGALGFYFGYVSSRSQYEYFGVDVDTIGLNTQDYVMRSPQPLLVPLLVLALVGAALLLVHSRIRRRIAASGSTARAAGLRRTVRVLAAAGLVALGTGVALLFVHSDAARAVAVFDLVTPLLLSFGAGLVAYASRIRSLLTGRHDAAEEDGTPRRFAAVLLYVVIAASVFWATATVAQWSGRGQAMDAARHMDRLPRVILDTKERLFLRDPGIEETVLPASEGQTFHYRYRRLRLLVVGHDRMFLVPDSWSASDSTLVVPLDGSVRVQFQFQNQLP
jgi:hypothetical protein